jgi:uncharacterized protein
MKSRIRPTSKKTATKTQKIPVKLAHPRGGPAGKKSLNIPAILLEGDPVPTGSGFGRRDELGPTESPPSLQALDQRRELPEAYGTKTLLLTARDPHWLYAHWDLTREQLQHHNALSTDHHLVLRVYLDRIAGEPLRNVHVHPESRNWFVHVGFGGRRYVAELGFHKADTTWVTICDSKPALTPTDELSKDTSARFATIPFEAPFDKRIQAIQDAASLSAPPADTIDQLDAAQQPFLPVVSPATAPWTPAQAEALAQNTSMDEARGGGIGSLEIAELIHPQIVSELVSEAAPQLSQPASWSGSVPSISNPRGGMERPKQFWFNINAELIIYGATEPDASVTIGGHPIKLRSDGTFSYRFALPDGTYHLPVVATSQDNSDGRSAELTCGRKTEYRGEVGVHPQDPALNEPKVS